MGTEVVLSIEEFTEMVNYTKELKAMVDKYEKIIKEYNLYAAKENEE